MKRNPPTINTGKDVPLHRPLDWNGLTTFAICCIKEACSNVSIETMLPSVKTVVDKRIQFDNGIIPRIVVFERHHSLQKTGLSVHVTGTQDRHKSKTRKAVPVLVRVCEPIAKEKVKILDFGLVVAGQRGLTLYLYYNRMSRRIEIKNQSPFIFLVQSNSSPSQNVL